jgi:hypothetical protein
MGHEKCEQLVSSSMWHVFVMGMKLMGMKAEFLPVSASKDYDICSGLPSCERSMDERNQIQLKTN